MQQTFYILIFLLAMATYLSIAVQMLLGQYHPSFFSRGAWFLLGVNGFAGVLLGGGSKSAVVLSGSTMIGCGVVFVMSYWYGSRRFKNIEKISLGLLAVSAYFLIFRHAPFFSLTITLAAEFIGGIPTIARAIRVPHSEQAWHWYIYLTASILTIIASPQKTIHALLFPLYFIFFESMMIILVNRRRLRGWLL